MRKQAPVTAQGPDYIPALSFDGLTPLHDSVLRWVMQEERSKRALLQRATIRDGQHVVDLGCGKGMLTVQTKLGHPGAIINGLDGAA
jgi:2-polyprenyl-3-methyl-5-hydroxy-6-metoxy-1,4-benzoquinol methylase